RRDVRIEHVRRLGDVIVHADQDQIVLVHAALPLLKGLVDNDPGHSVNGGRQSGSALSHWLYQLVGRERTAPAPR
ncbi:MAG: hypothetical protein WBZ37_27215, partial [Mycobacterium sp.]